MLSWKRYSDTRYLASNTGVIKNGETGRELSYTINTGGYACVSLYIPFRCTARVHVVVAKTFVDNPFNKMCVNHIDGNKLNNHVDNLEWLTHSENTQHAYDTGLKPKGEDVSWAKLTEEDVIDIKHMFVDAIPVKDIAAYYGVGASTISQIRQGEAWKHVLPELNWDITRRESCKRPLTAEDIPVIRQRIYNGESDTKIAETYAVHRGTIFQIRSGKNWKNY
jgi:hypothetical protein